VRVLLIRHGRSAHVDRGGLIGPEGLTRWRAGYDAAGITDDSRPPAALVTEVAQAAMVAASDLPRAQASAARVAPNREVVISPLFREVPIPPPSWHWLRAPRGVWDTLAYLRWLSDLLRGRDRLPGASEQARHAAEWCREACRRVAARGGTVAVVTHGVFRWILATQLVAEGWRFELGRRSYKHWSVWRLSAPATEETTEKPIA
jgi:broad specificity phosphatase PhoE